MSGTFTYRYDATGKGPGSRVETTMSEEAATETVGRRIMVGWETRQQFVTCRDGLTVLMVWNLDVDGHAWTVLYENKGW